MASKMPGQLIALVVGIFFLSESYWLIDKGEWPVWSEDKSRVLFSVFYIFGNRIGIYGAATLTGLLGFACIVGAIVAVRERPKDDK